LFILLINMKSKELLKTFQEYLEIEKERNLLMLEVSRLIGVDFTFSEEEMTRNVLDKIDKKMAEEIDKEMLKWMK
tara:strand:+ start:1207 stop:1431 length:225 start_codon:yes stop_codon:yes gene_type:complete